MRTREEKVSLNVVIGATTGREIKRISEMLLMMEAAIKVKSSFRTMREGRQILSGEEQPDLLFLDTDLSDGKSFQLLTKALLDVPVIFFSSSSNDAVHAFATNAIDYLLKPVRSASLAKAIAKFMRLRETAQMHANGSTPASTVHYRQRIVIRNGNRFQFRTVGQVALFYADGKSVYLVTRNGERKFLIDHTLGELERSLEPDAFFRISRKHIVPADCIAEVKGLISGKLTVKLNVGVDQELCVSRERASGFKQWLDR